MGSEDQALPLPKKILVADDSGVCRMRLKAMCKRLYPGCSIVMANDGDEAVESFEKEARAGESFDLVLMDLNMVGDDDRPQLTGMLDARNGPQASARIRRVEESISMDMGVEAPRAYVLVITGSTRTDRWDLAYYHGCGVDGFLSKPVSIQSLTDGVTAVQRKLMNVEVDDSESGRNLAAPALLGESPLFEQDSAKKIDMYIEPSLLEKASAEPIAGPFSNLAGGESTFAALAAGQLPDDINAALQQHQEELKQARMQQAVGGAAHEQRRSSIHQKTPAEAKLFVPDGNDSDVSNPSPMAKVKHTRRMAPRVPRRHGGASGDWGMLHEQPHPDTADEGHDAPKPRRTSTPADAHHIALLAVDSTMLMMQASLVQSISLEHLITQAESLEAATVALGSDTQRVAVLILTMGRTTEGALDTERVRAEAEAFWAAEDVRKPAPEAVRTTFVVLPEGVTPDSFDVSSVGAAAALSTPLRKLELLGALADVNTSAR